MGRCWSSRQKFKEYEFDERQRTNEKKKKQVYTKPDVLNVANERIKSEKKNEEEESQEAFLYHKFHYACTAYT